MNEIIFVGDIHGELKKLVWKLISKGIKNCSVIVAGDFGVGFTKKGHMDLLYEKIKKKLIDNDITIYTIRGNHDDPSYFDGKHNYDRLIFLQDYVPIAIYNKTILPIGGAVSIDSEDRIKKNKRYEKFGSSKRVWWEGEDVVRKELSLLPKKVDYIVSHEAPISFEPIIVRETENLDTWNKILSTRKYLDTICSVVNFNYWIFGHYHKSSSGSCKNGSLYRCLSIEEFLDFQIF